MSDKEKLKDLPFRPIRGSLYTSEELARGYELERPESLADTVDFQTYRYFVMNGRATPSDPFSGMMQALHDNSIAQAMFDFLKGYKFKAAIMGGHRETRDSDNYRNVVTLAKRLSEEDFLLASGGGPGAMEATHLGALLKGEDDKSIDEAIKHLSTQSRLPEGAEKVVDAEGKINFDIVKKLHEWAKPAHSLMSEFERPGKRPGKSLAVPTWHYGHEPVTPLATHSAKYFLNSIREDVLLLLASQGIIFAPGRAGTLQEVFQDAAQNYYPAEGSFFSPMVFFDADSFWSEKLPVRPLLEGLFKLGGPEREKNYQENVLFSADIDEILNFIKKRMPSEKQIDARIEKLGMSNFL